MKTRNRNGITLIALVITIIVLLILAGVSIAMLTGENGILNQTKQAKEETEKATDNEKTDLAKTESQINQYTGNNTVDGVTIPEGFYYAGGNKDNGLVISDQEGDDLENTKQGNQFVWVPVDGEKVKLERKSWQTPNGYNEEGIFGTYNMSHILGTAENKDKQWWEEESSEEYQKMITSVKRNKGFYVSRFEASYGEGIDTNTYKPLSIKSAKVVYSDFEKIEESKGTLWNFINQEEAIAASKNFNLKLNSHLLWGIEWDSILSWMISTNSVTLQNIEKDSSIFGNYKTDSLMELKNTGEVKKAEINHIFDLAGNLDEWTQEKYHTANMTVAVRGGRYYDDGYAWPVATRIGYTYWDKDDGVGIRFGLYL